MSAQAEHGRWAGLGPQDRRERPSRQRQQLKQRPGGGGGQEVLGERK